MTDIFSPDPNAVRLLRLLGEREMSVATAESCTGGLIASLITDVSGASNFLSYGFVTYSDEAKIVSLGVSAEALEEFGAVSELVALQMAQGVLSASGATLGIATTGFAGPGGGTEEDPEGTVYIGISVRGDSTFVVRCSFGAIGRIAVKRAAAEAAVQLAGDLLEYGVLPEVLS